MQPQGEFAKLHPSQKLVSLSRFSSCRSQTGSQPDKNRIIYTQPGGQLACGETKTSNKLNRIKNMKTLVVASALALVVCGNAIGQVHPSGGTLNHGAAEHKGDAASIVEHLAQFFPRIAAFDVNKDGKLDEGEKAALAKAVADGKVELPVHSGPQGEKPSADVLLAHVAEMYAYVARYDTNHDGELDETEKAAIIKAIENGEFAPHGAHGPEGGGEHQ
jgi:hypothetical protein